MRYLEEEEEQALRKSATRILCCDDTLALTPIIHRSIHLDRLHAGRGQGHSAQRRQGQDCQFEDDGHIFYGYVTRTQ